MVNNSKQMLDQATLCVTVNSLLFSLFQNLCFKQCISSHQIRFSEKIIAQFKTHQDSLTFEGVRRVLFVFVLYFPCAFSFKYPSKYLIKITPLKVSKSYRTLHQSFHSFAFCLLFLGTFYKKY